jgi:MFS family permease
MGDDFELVSEEHPRIAKKIKEGLDISVKEGAVSSLSSGFGLSYLSPFAIAMNATASQVGILYGIINLFPSIIQLRASSLMQKISIKKIVLWGVMAQIILWFFVILSAVGFYKGFSFSIWFLIIISTLIYSFNALVYPAWFLWMGFIVPDRIRGMYFSKRNLIVGLFGMASMIIAAVILDEVRNIAFGKESILFYTLLGFVIIFFLALLFRVWSWRFLKRTYSPQIKLEDKDCFTLWQFLKRAPATPFGRFVIFRGFFSIAIGISLPFFSVYLLRNLGLSYMWFMAITVSAIFFQLIFLPLLGKVSDRFGNIQLTRISVGLIFMVPGLWAASALISNLTFIKWYLLTIPSIVGGFAWAGYNLATNNYVYDAVSQKKRGFGAMYMNLFVGVGVFIGSIVGSIIAKIGVSFMDTILFIFLFSTVARFLVFIFGAKHLEEVRPVKKFSSRFLIKEFKPLHETIREVHYLEGLIGVKKFVKGTLKVKHPEQLRKDISHFPF